MANKPLHALHVAIDRSNVQSSSASVHVIDTEPNF